MRRRERGQSTVEFAVLMMLLIGALLAMQGYMKRALSGRLREGADVIGQQYDPKGTTSTFAVTSSTDTTTESTLLKDQLIQDRWWEGFIVVGDAVQTNTFLNKSETSRVGNEQVGPLKSDIWQ